MGHPCIFAASKMQSHPAMSVTKVKAIEQIVFSFSCSNSTLQTEKSPACVGYIFIEAPSWANNDFTILSYLIVTVVLVHIFYAIK